MFGVPDWEDLYHRIDLDDGGVMTGPTLEMRMIQEYISRHKRPASQVQALSISSGAPARQPQCRPCATQRDCSADGAYRCVTSVKISTDARLREGCCRLDTWSGSQGRQLLGIPPQAADQNASMKDTLLSAHDCACNCTYVSQACCGADDGIVSEPISLQLGVLAPSDTTVCCNRDTGRFMQGMAQSNSTFC